MALDLAQQSSKVDPCCYYRVKDGQFFFILVHVDDYAVACSDQINFVVLMAHFWGALDTEDYLGVKLIGGVTHLLHMRISRQHQFICLDQER